MLPLVFLLGILALGGTVVNTRVPSWWRPEQPRESEADTPALFFKNNVDHFDSLNTATFDQRYWSNGQYYKTGGPVFVVISGGLSGDPYWITNSSSEWCTLAATHQAWLFLVEHRYYGQSRMTEVERTDTDFQWLNAVQSTEDFIVFIRTMKGLEAKFQLAKWAAMGASYAGNLAVWLRQRYPSEVSFVVVSSPPLQAKYDYTEMLEGVMEALQNVNQDCASSVSQGFNQVAQLMQTAQGRNSLKNTFNLCTDLNPSDTNSLRYFWSTIINPYTSMVLYGGDNYNPYRSKLTIQQGICRFHTNPAASIMVRMQSTFLNFNTAFGFGSFCTDIDYDSFIGYLTNATDSYSDETRAWIWQQCTELGYFITTDSPTAGPFFGGNANLPLEWVTQVPVKNNPRYYTNACQTIFGQQYDANYGNQGVNKVNTRFGGNHGNATYTIILNGDHDPWRRLSTLNSTNDNVFPIIINGAGHRSDIYPYAGDDSTSLKNARAQISSIIKTWLAT